VWWIGGVGVIGVWRSENDGENGKMQESWEKSGSSIQHLTLLPCILLDRSEYCTGWSNSTRY